MDTKCRCHSDQNLEYLIGRVTIPGSGTSMAAGGPEAMSGQAAAMSPSRPRSLLSRQSATGPPVVRAGDHHATRGPSPAASDEAWVEPIIATGKSIWPQPSKRGRRRFCSSAGRTSPSWNCGSACSHTSGTDRLSRMLSSLCAPEATTIEVRKRPRPGRSQTARLPSRALLPERWQAGAPGPAPD